MRLALLLEEARSAGPGQRIEWRDPIASYGERAIVAVKPWLEDPIMAAFAIRVIERVGEQGRAEVAIRVLDAARRRAPARLSGDLDWAIRRLRQIVRLERTGTHASPGHGSGRHGAVAANGAGVAELGAMWEPAGPAARGSRR
jgi:hypothetical protein